MKFKTLLFCFFCIASFLQVAAQPYQYNEYQIDFPESWKPISDDHLKAYLGAYQRNTAQNPVWKDPAFARGWNLGKSKKKNYCMCVVYRMKNERNATLDGCANGIAYSYQQRKGSIKNFAIKDKGELYVNGRQMKWFDVTMTSNDLKVAIRHFITLDSGYAYYIYFTTVPKYFSKVQAQSMGIAQSFKIAHTNG